MAYVSACARGGAAQGRAAQERALWIRLAYSPAYVVGNSGTNLEYVARLGVQD